MNMNKKNLIQRIFSLLCKYKELERGVIALPAVLALSIIILALIIGISAMTFNEGFVSLGGVQSAKALNYADVGARDALLRIGRNKNYNCTAPALPTGCYQIDTVANGCATNEGCARVTVDNGTSPKIINVEGRATSFTRKIQVNVTFDASLNGEITSTQWQELTN